MITREQVADLRPGDVVEISGYPVLEGATVRGPVVASEGRGKRLTVGPVVVRHSDGTPPMQYSDDSEFTLTVVSRAPRPLYVNHPRTEAAIGDVAQLIDLGPRHNTWHHLASGWCDSWGNPMASPVEARRRGLRLLVDGETGQVVP